jgi:hypothetical protein
MKNVIVLGAGGNIARKVIDILKDIITKIIESPEKYIRQNLGVNKQGS